MGRPLVWFPNLVFRLVRSAHLRPNQVAFRVDKSVNKLEIKKCEAPGFSPHVLTKAVLATSSRSTG